MKTILAAVDFSNTTPSVIDSAYTQAKSLGARLRIVHAAAPDPDFVGYDTGPQHERDFRAKTLRDERRQLESIAKDLKERGIDVVVELIQGPTIEVLLKEIATNEIDLAIVGSHGHGALFNLVVGSVTQAILKASQIPVLVVPSRPAAD